MFQAANSACFAKKGLGTALWIFLTILQYMANGDVAKLQQLEFCYCTLIGDLKAKKTGANKPGATHIICWVSLIQRGRS